METGGRLPVRITWKLAVLTAALLTEGVFSRWLGIVLDPPEATCLSIAFLVLVGLVLFSPSFKLREVVSLPKIPVLIPVCLLAFPRLAPQAAFPVFSLLLIQSICAFLPDPAGQAALGGFLVVLPVVLFRILGLFPEPLVIGILLLAGYLIGELYEMKFRGASVHKWIRTLCTMFFGIAGSAVVTALAGLSLVLLIFLFGREIPLSFTPGKVIIDEGHASTESAHMKLGLADPLKGNYGHGCLVDVLRSWGFSVELADKPLRSTTLADSCILVLIMPSRPYSPQEVDAIHRFVKRGGSLLGIGDHTDLDGAMSHLNPLFEPLGLMLEFDAVKIPAGNAHHLQFGRHPAVRGVRDLSISTGASISGPKMVPLLWTRSSTYADRGQWRQGRGYLDNRVHDPSEAVGFQVLAAAARPEKGTVALVGDSSCFQNTNLFCNLPFARSLFSWLSSRSSPRPFTALAIFGVILATALLTFAASSRYQTGLRALSIVVVLVAGVLLGELKLSEASFARNEPPGKPVVGLDLAHSPRFDLYYRTADKQPGEYLDSLCLQMVRLGITPRLITGTGWSQESLKGCRGLVIPPIGRELSPDEVGMVRTFIETGGRVFTFTGGAGSRVKPVPRAATAWLTEFGIHVDPEPLWLKLPVIRPDGLVGHYRPPPYQAVFSADEGLLTNVLKLYLDDPHEVHGTEPCMTLQEVPVAGLHSAGRGGLVVVGDPEVFLDHHMEDTGGVYDAHKVTFCRNIVKYLAGGEIP